MVEGLEKDWGEMEACAGYPESRNRILSCAPHTLTICTAWLSHEDPSIYHNLLPPACYACLPHAFAMHTLPLSELCHTYTAD